jgi:hypothetical protein
MGAKGADLLGRPRGRLIHGKSGWYCASDTVLSRSLEHIPLITEVL